VTFIAFSFVFCTKSPVVSDNGSGTGVGNGIISGRVLYADSTPVKGAVVLLRTQGYLADTAENAPKRNNDTLATVSTDSSGTFHLESIGTGNSYCVEVRDNNQKPQATLIKLALTNDSQSLGTRIVKPVIKVLGKVTLTGLPANAFVQVYGLEILSRTDSSGSFEINDLPVGECERGECEYKLRIFSPLPGGGIVSKDCELEISSDKDTTIAKIELEGR
jgi:hypothetical protein